MQKKTRKRLDVNQIAARVTQQAIQKADPIRPKNSQTNKVFDQMKLVVHGENTSGKLLPTSKVSSENSRRLRQVSQTVCAIVREVKYMPQHLDCTKPRSLSRVFGILLLLLSWTEYAGATYLHRYPVKGIRRNLARRYVWWLRRRGILHPPVELFVTTRETESVVAQTH